MSAKELGRHAAGTAVASSTVVVALLVGSLSDKLPASRQTGSRASSPSQDCASPDAPGCEEESETESDPETSRKPGQKPRPTGRPSSTPSTEQGAPPASSSGRRSGDRGGRGGGAGSARSGGGKGWAHPIEGRAMGAAFGNSGGRWSRGHTGVDFPARVGTPVAAAGHGTVVKAGPRGGGDGKAYGNAVVIKHAGGTFSQYAHLLKVEVKVGDTVRAGQRIGLSGNTGNSTGPHLHFEIRTTPNYGSAIDPVKFLRRQGVSL